MGSLANSEDPGEMPQNAAFYLGLHCLLTHISLASFLWDIGKQCRPRSDAVECAFCRTLPKATLKTTNLKQ